MATANENPGNFRWNTGGWFGSQFGCTLWLLILGIVLLGKDIVSAGTCVMAFVVLNAWGLHLWRARQRLDAYVGVQRFLFATSVGVAVAVLVVNMRGTSEPARPGGLVSTALPYGVIAMPPALMLMFFFLQRQRRGAMNAEPSRNAPREGVGRE